MVDDVSASDGKALPDDRMKWPRYAGFWRRLAASIIDYILVLIVLLPLASLAFVSTDGEVKSLFLLRWNLCQSTTLNQTSGPSLANYEWVVCRASIFGLKTAQWAEGTASDQKVEPSSISFDLDSNGRFRPSSLDLGFLELAILAAYFFLGEWRFGQSIGKRSLGIKIYDQDQWNRVGLPAWKSFRRQAMKFAGVAPMVLSGGWYSFRAWGGDPAMVGQFPNFEIAIAFAVLAIAAAWPIWIMISIALGNDAIHDRFAGTTVRLPGTEA
ncbi:hypothetical protein MAUB1S_06966 [Mycolicibacterium aubagnense]